MQTMLPSEVQIAVARKIGATFVGLVTCTETKMNRGGNQGNPKNPFFNAVRSVRRINAQFNYLYDGAVERQLAKEINAERAQNEDNALEGDALTDEINSRFNRGTSWYEIVEDEQGRLTPFCKHKKTGDIYFRCRTIDKGDTSYIATRNIEGTPYSEGDTISFESLEPYFPKTKPYKNQGTEKPIAATTLKLESVVAIAMDGEQVKIVPNDDHLPAAVRRWVDAKIEELYAA